MSSLLKADSVVLNPFSALMQLTDADYDWIGSKIYQNEAASNPKYLTHWGKGEGFPSFGIAHFIWFPNISPPPYQETFPAMLEFVAKSSPPPYWLQKLKQSSEFDAPWKNKAEFDSAQDSDELKVMRHWLETTQAQQARFIVLSFQPRWLKETASMSPARLEKLNQRLSTMMSFKQGVFAVIDYFNFKGIGHNEKEQYQGKSWGLVSVLENMPNAAFNGEDNHKFQLAAFIDSAKKQLQQRTELAPDERNESRWIPGWFARLEGYAQP
ncbi:MAG: hypothetical protein L3J38_03670 [Thiomicrorhabdus sp.]|nr:hypothetical protein [Thiomicrorhabdus sp.]